MTSSWTITKPSHNANHGMYFGHNHRHKALPWGDVQASLHKDYSVFAPSQWKTMLQCNTISHWAYKEWSLLYDTKFDLSTTLVGAVLDAFYRDVIVYGKPLKLEVHFFKSYPGAYWIIQSYLFCPTLSLIWNGNKYDYIQVYYLATKCNPIIIFQEH